MLAYSVGYPTLGSWGWGGFFSSVYGRLIFLRHEPQTETGVADLNHCSICSWFTAPGCCITIRPPENTTKFGMPRTLKRAASCGNFSVSTLSTTALPAMSAAVRATSGAAMWHGPHHSAQKSTNTGTGEF